MPDVYLESEWREELYALQTVMPFQPSDIDAERAPWTQIPRWIEESQEDGFRRKVVDIGGGRAILLALARQILSGDPALVLVEPDVECVMAETLEEFRIDHVANNIESMMDMSMLRGANLVILTEVLQYFKYSALSTFQRLHEVLAEDGILLISTPDSKSTGKTYRYRSSLGNCPLSGLDPSVPAEPHWIYSRDEIEALARASGFHVDRFAYAGIGHRHVNYQLSPE